MLQLSGLVQTIRTHSRSQRLHHAKSLNITSSFSLMINCQHICKSYHHVLSNILYELDACDLTLPQTLYSPLMPKTAASQKTVKTRTYFTRPECTKQFSSFSSLARFPKFQSPPFTAHSTHAVIHTFRYFYSARAAGFCSLLG